jgi:response regulator RpfG family c-di-GMP phosphodiesterase
VGCSSTAARVSEILDGDDLDFKGGLRRIDWNQPSEAVRHIVGSTSGSPFDRVRRVVAVARKGAQILRLLAFPDATVVAMASADEHWDGRGKPAGLTPLRAGRRDRSGDRHRPRPGAARRSRCSGGSSDTAEVRDLRRAGLLHDLGKLGVPNTVLDKPGKLTPEEWELMRRHPAYTAEVLAHVECLRTVAGTAASHHERLDGSGYHRGLDASVLPVPARILAVADVYDALAHDRPYHAAMPTERALAILDADAGTRLDRESIAALHRLLDGVAVDLAA